MNRRKTLKGIVHSQPNPAVRRRGERLLRSLARARLDIKAAYAAYFRGRISGPTLNNAVLGCESEIYSTEAQIRALPWTTRYARQLLRDGKIS